MPLTRQERSKLPNCYLDFYDKCQVKIPDRMFGLETPNTVPILTLEAGWMMERLGFPNFLNETHFVFLMINEHSFFYFQLGEEDPEVYFWSSRLRGSRLEGKLSDHLSSLQD